MVQISTEQLIGQVEQTEPEATALRRLELATTGAERLTAAADRLVGHYVEAARGEGASWTEIGAALGVSKQAAQQRHVAREAAGGAWLTGFSADGRDAVHLAIEEARRLRHRYVGTEHLLLGILALGRGPAYAVLTEAGVTADGARQRALDIVGRGESPFAGDLGLTARSHKVLELATRETRQLGAAETGAEHVLLGLVREGHGVAAMVLQAMTGDAGALRTDVIRAVG